VSKRSKKSKKSKKSKRSKRSKRNRWVNLWVTHEEYGPCGRKREKRKIGGFL